MQPLNNTARSKISSYSDSLAKSLSINSVRNWSSLATNNSNVPDVRLKPLILSLRSIGSSETVELPSSILITRKVYFIFNWFVSLKPQTTF
ncbi:unnamed protein product [Schistosoma haematobium]|nr:unnamed protein product [Schistosoma haematobium]